MANGKGAGGIGADKFHLGLFMFSQVRTPIVRPLSNNGMYNFLEMTGGIKKIDKSWTSHLCFLNYLLIHIHFFD